MVTNFIIWNDNHLTDNFKLLFELLNNNPPESIKLKCYDDDRPGQPEKWTFEIVDKGYIDRADALLQTQITTNTTNIQNNANNIAANSQHIADNALRIQDHEQRITQNTNNITLANGRITQNASDISTLTSRVNSMQASTQGALDKIYRAVIGGNFYRLHSYVSYVGHNKVNLDIEVDFYVEQDGKLAMKLKDIVPWIDVISASPYQIDNKPCCGVEIPLTQTPTIDERQAITFDYDNNIAKCFGAIDIGKIITNSSTTFDQMILECSSQKLKTKCYGRFFMRLVFTY